MDKYKQIMTSIAKQVDKVINSPEALIKLTIVMGVFTILIVVFGIAQMEMQTRLQNRKKRRMK